MSAITGLLRLRDRVSGKEIEEMNRVLNHRGPDGVETKTRGPAGFGHQSLETTPEADSLTLPVHDETYLFTCDARIDNRDELRSRLAIEANREVSDAELILAAYDKWGERCPEALLGAFAFAVWDSEAERLFLARDHMGVKPLYYYTDETVFAFATEMKALLAREFIDGTINQKRVGTYLVGHDDQKEQTAYDELYRVPPATAMTVESHSVSKQTYWELDPSRELHLGSDEAYTEQFREIFADAVRSRMRGAPPIGTTLSGGLDSSSVACTAAHYRTFDEPVHTFSLVFDDLPACDEREYIEAVLREGSFESHYIPGDSKGPLSYLDEILWCADGPFAGTNMFMHRDLYRSVADQNVRILLEGVDGDSVVSHGFRYLAELASSGRLLSLARAVKAASEFELFEQRSIRQVLWQFVVTPLAPESGRSLWRRVRGGEDVVANNPIIDKAFADRIGLRQMIEQSASRFEPARTERQFHYNQLQNGVQPRSLELANKVAGYYGVEPRFPFFDKRLVEFCLALPASQKFHVDGTRIVLRRSLSDILPDAIESRTDKASSAENLKQGLLRRNGEKLTDLVEELPDPLESMIASTELARVRQSAREQDPTLDEIMTLWRVAVLSRWMSDNQSDETNSAPAGPKRCENHNIDVSN